MTGSVTSTGFRRSALAFGAACAFFAASGPALACNPFELLFGGCRETQTFRSDAPVYYQPSSSGEHVRAEKPKARVSHAATANANGVSGKQKPIGASADAPVGSLALFAKDRTLRAGDVVVTTTGFKVYEARGSFAPIAHDGGRLATLEKVSIVRKTTDNTFAAAADRAKGGGNIVAANADDAPPARPSPIGLRAQARAGRIVASGG